MLLKKMALSSMLVCLTILLTSCLAFLFPPPYDKEEVAKEMKKYLKNKYGKEFTVTNLDRNCHEGDFNSCYMIWGTGSPKDNPRIQFRVFYYLKEKGTPSDEYRSEFWTDQIEQEWSKEVKKAFYLDSKKGTGVSVFIADGEYLSHEATLVNYREEIGKDIHRISFRVYKGDKTKKEIGDPAVVRKEAESLIELKKRLIAKDVKESELKYYHVVVKDGRRYYDLTMDHVVDAPDEMAKRIQQIERRDKSVDYETNTVPYYKD